MSVQMNYAGGGSVGVVGFSASGQWAAVSVDGSLGPIQSAAVGESVNVGDVSTGSVLGVATWDGDEWTLTPHVATFENLGADAGQVGSSGGHGASSPGGTQGGEIGGRIMPETGLYRGSTGPVPDHGTSAILHQTQELLAAASWIPGPIGSLASIGGAGINIYQGNYWAAAGELLGVVPFGKAIASGVKAAKSAKAVSGGLEGLSDLGAGVASIVKNSKNATKGGRKIPNSQLGAPPPKRGNAPIGSDGHPVELHHRGQSPNSPLDEMTRTEHRGQGNFGRNHSNTGQSPSKIDRGTWRGQQRDYWNGEWDGGRFDDF